MNGRPRPRQPNATLQSRNLATRKGRTSVRLEKTLWDVYDEVSRASGLTRNQLSRFIDEHRPSGAGFTSTVRVFLVAYFRACFRHADATVDEVLTMAAAIVADVEPTPITAAEAHRRTVLGYPAAGRGSCTAGV